MAAFWKRRNDTRSGVVLAVSSGSVHAGVVVSEHGAMLPRVLHSVREPLPTGTAAGLHVPLVGRALASALSALPLAAPL